MSLPLAPAYLRSAEARFVARVDPTVGLDSCWPWMGTIGRKGYGQLSVGGKYGGRTVLAHRMAWEREHGPIPDGLQVCHACDCPPCCNPSHLFLGTSADNQHDKAAKGRAPRGEANPAAVLTVAEVHSIRAAVAAGTTYTQAGADHGVSRTTAKLIATRQRWSHVP